MVQKRSCFCTFIGLLLMLTPVLSFGQFRVENETRSNLNIMFQNPDFEIKTERIGATEYDYVSTQVPTVTVESGSPELPFYSSTIEIPNTGNPSINLRVTESEFIKNVNIKPVKENNLQPLSFNNTVYTKNVFYPTSKAQIGEPAILRNKRLVNFIVNPFRYNDATNTLEVIKKAEIEISFDNESSVNEITRSTMKPTKSFENFFSSAVLNYKEPNSRDDYDSPSILYIYYSNFEGESALEDLLNWRREQGWTVYTASTAVTGTTTTTIKDYIQNAYDNWENPPSYVTLIGDASISTYIEIGYEDGNDLGGGDHDYALLEGDDDLEDVFLGRLPVDYLPDLATIVAKTIAYEKASGIPDSDYYTKALLVGKTQESGQSTVMTNLYVKEIMADYNSDFTFVEYYDYVVSPTLVLEALDEGVGFWNYRGLEGLDGLNPYLINELSNVDELTVAVVLTANTGAFYNGTSIAERLIWAGTESELTGAVCAIGLGQGTHTTYTNCLDGGIMGHLFAEGGWTMGAANNRGKHYLWEAYNTTNSYMLGWHSLSCNLLGDSALRIYKESPNLFNTEFIANIASGADQIKVSTNIDGNTFPNVWTTLNIGEEYYSGYTNYSGDIFFDIPEDVEGQGLLTVSKEGYKPQQHQLTFGVDASVLNVTGVTLYEEDEEDDEVDYVTPGNSYSLKLQVTNNGPADIPIVEALIIPVTNGLVVTESQVYYGDIMQSESVINTDNFQFTVEDRAYDSDIAFTILLSSNSDSWERQITLPVQSPIVEVTNFSLSNSDFAPGETSNITLQVINAGTAPFMLADATLSSIDNRMGIDNSTVSIGLLFTGESTNLNFAITASEELLPGDLVPMIITINDDGFESESYFSIQVGEASVTDPLGPDAYGYYIFDSDDTDYDDCPEYDWIELNPELGGVGQSLPSLLLDNGNDQQQVVTLALPFTFKFYGVDYEEITVCSNGWITMGETEQTTFRNWRLPGPLGASPMIAPFWDNLVIGPNSNAFFAYDEVEHYFVVTWDDWQNYNYGTTEETFQVILYDPEYHTSSTGDAPIKFQYKVVHNVDSQVNYDHGQFASVGIEDHTATVGLEYTYNNQYPQAAKALENEMALFITTKVGQLPPFVINQPNHIVFEEDYIDDSLDLFNVFKDPNNDNLEFSFIESDNLNLEINEEGYLVITPNQDWNGSEVITIFAEDGVNESQTSESLLVTVVPVNDRPILESKIPELSNIDSNSGYLNFSVLVNDVDSELSYMWKIDNEIIEGAESDTLDYVFDNVGEHTVKCYASDSDFTIIPTWNVNVAVSDDVDILAVNQLSQNNPNPFNPSTTINFSLKKNSNVSIIVYNVKGQKVRTLVSRIYNQGNHNVIWDGLDDNKQAVSSGLYFYRMISDEFQSTKKAIMMK